MKQVGGVEKNRGLRHGISGRRGGRGGAALSAGLAVSGLAAGFAEAAASFGGGVDCFCLPSMARRRESIRLMASRIWAVASVVGDDGVGAGCWACEGGAAVFEVDFRFFGLAAALGGGAGGEATAGLEPVAGAWATRRAARATAAVERRGI